MKRQNNPLESRPEAWRAPMVLYVAGRIGGLVDPLPAFDHAEKVLLGHGFQVLNPARHGEGDTAKSWADYMRLGLTDVLTADGVAVLPGWENSRGAALETHVARCLGMPVRPVGVWFRMPPSEHRNPEWASAASVTP